MPATTSLKDLALGDLDLELAATLAMLERLPERRFGWKPHEKSWTLGEPAAHTVNLLFWQTITLTEDGYDLAEAPAQRQPAEGQEALLREFDKNAEALRVAVAEIGDEGLGAPWTLTQGGQAILTDEKISVFRRMGVSHMVHHRARLGVYLRLLDMPVPATYGPSRDEAPSFGSENPQ